MMKKLISLGLVLLMMIFALMACEQGSELSAYKTAAKAELTDYVNDLDESEYISANWMEIAQIVVTGANIDSATNMPGVDSALLAAKINVDHVPLAESGNGEEIDFAVGSIWRYGLHELWEYGTILLIVRSLGAWNGSDAAQIIRIDEKYDDAFFVENALVIIAFSTSTGGHEVEEINVAKQGNCLMVDINGTRGVSTAVSSVIVALEVKKDDVAGLKNINLTTNLPKIF